MHNNGIFVGGNLTVSGGEVRNTVAPDTSRRQRTGIDVLVIAVCLREDDVFAVEMAISVVLRSSMQTWKEEGCGRNGGVVS